MRFWLKKKIQRYRIKNRKKYRGISRWNVRKTTASSGKLVSTIGAHTSPKKGTSSEPGVRKGERSLLTCQNQFNVWKGIPIFLIAPVSLVYIFSYIIMYHILRTLISAIMGYISSLTQLCSKSGPRRTSLNGNHKEGFKAIITYKWPGLDLFHY